MKTTVNKIYAHNPSVSLVERLTTALGGEFGVDQEFNLADITANLTDVLWILGQEGKSALVTDFAIFCAISLKVPHADEAALNPELAALTNPTQAPGSFRTIANGMQNVNPIHGRSGCEENSPVWRKRRAVQQALLARASTDPAHAAHYAQHAFTWSYQVSKRGLQEKLIELLLLGDDNETENP